MHIFHVLYKKHIAFYNNTCLLFVCSSTWTTHLAINCHNIVSNANSVLQSFIVLIQQTMTTNRVVYCYTVT